MSTVTKLITADEFWSLPDDHLRHELIQGELTTMPPAGSEHGAIGANLTVSLGYFVKQNRLGQLFNSDTGFILERDPDSVRCPDLAFIKQERIPLGGITKKFWPGAPDLAVEVVSPSDTAYEVDEKVQQWLAAGTAMVVVVNPKQKTVTVYRPPGTAKILSADDTFDGEEVVPGFTCQVKEMFV